MVRVYKDHGISSAKGRDQRLQFNQTHEDATSGRFEVMSWGSFASVGRYANSQPGWRSCMRSRVVTAGRSRQRAASWRQRSTLSSVSYLNLVGAPVPMLYTATCVSMGSGQGAHASIMGAIVTVETVPERILAAVVRKVPIGGVGAAWGPPLGQVWAFLRTQPSLRANGHNVFLYHHPLKPGDPMDAYFGVEVVREFAPAGEVAPVRTPAGEVAIATHYGAYSQMGETHDAIHVWGRANQRIFAGKSWEIYGDPSPDPAKTETSIVYLLS
jgi:hypothetical protein